MTDIIAHLLGSDLYNQVLELKRQLERRAVRPFRVELGERQQGLLTCELVKLARETVKSEEHELLPGIWVPMAEPDLPDWITDFPTMIHGLAVERHASNSRLVVVGQSDGQMYWMSSDYPPTQAVTRQYQQYLGNTVPAYGNGR